MSKKKKFKQKFKQEILNQINKQNVSDTTVISPKLNADLPKNPSADLVSQQTQIISPYVKKDLAKIFLMMGLILLILIAISLLNIKTDWVNRFSQQLADFLHLYK